MNRKNISTIQRNDGIDILRGLCILMVILVHCKIHMPLPSFFPISIQDIIFSSGYYGVCMFFVISGFLITTTCLNRWGSLKHINPMRFYQMRFARIAPCLLLLLFILSILHLTNVTGFKITTTSLYQTLFSAFTFHVNWLEAQTGYLPANWDVLWSLSIEEIFYLFFPVICLVFNKRSHFIFLMLLFIAVAPFARTSFTHNDMWSDHSYLSCMDGIAFGCLAALFFSHVKMNKKLSYTLFISGLFIFTFIFFFRRESYALGISKVGLNVTLLELSISLMLIVMQTWYVEGKRQSSLITLPLRRLGCNSYEIYLTHSFFVISFGNFIFNKNQSLAIVLLWYAIVVLLSASFGQFIATYFSSPMNHLLREKKKIPAIITI